MEETSSTGAGRRGRRRTAAGFGAPARSERGAAGSVRQIEAAGRTLCLLASTDQEEVGREVVSVWRAEARAEALQWRRRRRFAALQCGEESQSGRSGGGAFAKGDIMHTKGDIV